MSEQTEVSFDAALIPMKKIARRNFLKLVGVSASIPILQSLPIASASATDLSDYPLLKDGIFDFENTDITQYVDDVQEVFGSEKDMIEEMLSSGELTPQDLKQHLLELAEQPSSVLVERGFSESQIAIIEEYDGIEDAFDYLYKAEECINQRQANRENIALLRCGNRQYW